ncbi:MAG: colanic acid biosynthesis glycosyltransferase WcaL [Alphaproteobacteria bacterium]|nr:MAG: colanic acid biosynthesis glycosyltransferase WcaL [Alphaproteobacteria bacterium]
MTKRKQIAVLVKRFPKLSETFILGEILALEELGWPITIFTLEPPTDTIRHPDVAKVKAPVIQLNWKRPEADLARFCAAMGIAHIHSHFAGRPSEIAQQAAHKCGIGFSISAHAKDIYTSDRRRLARVMRDARFIATCTSHNAEYLRDVAPGVPVAKLYHGIDCDRFLEHERKECDLPLILSVGRLRTKKGFDLLLRACAELANDGRRFVCEIIGYGPEEPRLRALAANLGIADHVILSGKQSHEYVRARLAAATVFALPCRIDPDGDRDGIPNAILEAMAAGVPVVSTNVSGVPEVLHHGGNGLVVEPENPIELASAIAKLLEAPEYRASLAGNAQGFVRDAFGSGKDIAALDRLLLSATGEGGDNIGYFVKGFPRLSESFISNEVLGLEQLGKQLTLFAGARGDDLAAPVLARLNSPLAYLPAPGSVSKSSLVGWLRVALPAYAPVHWRLMRRNPRGWSKALLCALRFARQYRHQDGRRFKRSYLKQFAQAGAVAEAVGRAGVTHLHGHFCHSATTITWLAADMAGVPFSFTAHAKDIYQARHNPADLLSRKVDAARFVTTCTAANHEHMAERVEEPAKLHTVYHGLDTSFFHPAKRERHEALRILAVGRHVEKKGFDLLLRSLAELKRRKIAFTCRLIGENGPATQALEALAAALELGDHFAIEPPLSRDALRSAYHASDVFVLPCRIDDSGDRDGIPNVLAEAMATGLAVVSTDVSGIPEIVDHDVNGLLVTPEDSSELADALARLADDDLLRRRLGQAATARIAEVFDASKTIHDLNDLFEGTIWREAAE